MPYLNEIFTPDCSISGCLKYAVPDCGYCPKHCSDTCVGQLNWRLCPLLVINGKCAIHEKHQGLFYSVLPVLKKFVVTYAHATVNKNSTYKYIMQAETSSQAAIDFMNANYHKGYSVIKVVLMTT